MKKNTKKVAKKATSKVTEVKQSPQVTKVKSTPTSLLELLGEKQESIYNHDDIESYSSYLRSLSMYDMQHHSIEVNVRPVSDRNTLTKILESHFLEYMKENSKFIKNTKPKDLHSLLSEFDKDDRLKRKTTQKTLFDI